jgi:NADPH:quinone reductase-like Zn-dependent oxidoreductase
VTFPRVLGIECVGIVAASTDPRLPDGMTVAAVMGEMGREFDGGYAEYALLPNSLLMPVTTTLPWDVLAALPETYLTAQGALDALGVVPGRPGRLLIRGGTSSVGMAAASIASGYGIETAATTRRHAKAGPLAAAGADYTLVEGDGSLAASVHAIWPEGPDCILDLVGASRRGPPLHGGQPGHRQARRAAPPAPRPAGRISINAMPTRFLMLYQLLPGYFDEPPPRFSLKVPV